MFIKRPWVAVAARCGDRRSFHHHPVQLVALAAFVVAVAAPVAAHAYVGPGAGVAVLTTLFVLVSTVFVAIAGLLVWPVRFVWLRLTRKRPPRPPKIERAVIVGLDGLDPELVRRFMGKGRLPTLKALSERGTMVPLKTTYPAMSPVAWSSFATGVRPDKHGIYDFLTRDRRTYLPELSSAYVGGPKRHLKIGKWRLPIGKPDVRMLRRSVPFWKILGAHQVPCAVLRVPITFPAEPIEGGTMLSAMCVPDLKGTQGSFTYFATAGAGAESIGGELVPIEVKDGVVETALEGPENPLRTEGEMLRVPMTLKLHPEDNAATLEINGAKHRLEVGRFSQWVPVAFTMGFGMKVRGIVQFRLLEVSPEVRLYATPINIDPARPVLPVSYPHFFSVFLARLIGRFATLGLAEDTWALNEGVIDEEAFLEQAWSNHGERESMFFEMLDRMPKGVTACVFDGTDRIQHMFMRFLDDGHPARRSSAISEQYADVIEDTYARMDAMLAKVFDKVPTDDPRTLVVVMSDHGFKSFRRGVNLNSWLHREGYLVLDEGRTASGEWFRGVDWTKTRAFALGLGGIFLNVKGRESEGMVPAGEGARALADEISGRLTGLVDPGVGAVAIDKAWSAHELYDGPYAENAPDILVGYAAGWRASWDGVRGIVDDVLFDDNTKAWSGDHCIDPRLVPGVFIANQALEHADGRTPAITDVAPTLLGLFGIPAPRHMDGERMTVRSAGAS